jgi:hypothetical protein
LDIKMGKGGLDRTQLALNDRKGYRERVPPEREADHSAMAMGSFLILWALTVSGVRGPVRPLTAPLPPRRVEEPARVQHLPADLTLSAWDFGSMLAEDDDDSFDDPDSAGSLAPFARIGRNDGRPALFARRPRGLPSFPNDFPPLRC